MTEPTPAPTATAPFSLVALRMHQLRWEVAMACTCAEANWTTTCHGCASLVRFSAEILAGSGWTAAEFSAAEIEEERRLAAAM